MEDKFLERIVEEIEFFEERGWNAVVMGNFPKEELYIITPEGWGRNGEYCKMENYVGASKERKDAINFSKLCRAAYKYFPQLWSENIV